LIEEGAFFNCERLVQVETHDGIRRVEAGAFNDCKSLRWLNLKSAVEIGIEAFRGCGNLESVEFGYKLETIRTRAFDGCTSLKRLKLPSIITIGVQAFWRCKALTDVEVPERLETVRGRAFYGCERLERIAIPLKRDLFEYDDVFERYDQFDGCGHLVTVDLVGETHTKTVASLHMESWRSEMVEEINRINQVLPTKGITIPTKLANEKTDEIEQWMDSVLDKIDHYRAEHCRYVKEGITILELALWKAKLDEKEDNFEEGRVKKAKLDDGSARKEKRITCGADTVIKNVLPFLNLE